MKPLSKMKARTKAVMLHGMFPAEVQEFIAFLNTLSVETIDDKEELQRVWGNQVIDCTYWNRLALLAHKRLKHYGEALLFCPILFDKALFKGEIALFTIHGLKAYGERSECSPKFRQAVQLLFTY